MAEQAGVNNIETKVMDGENLALEDETFDAVISRVGLIYFPDQQKALKEMLRVLKPGGKVFSQQRLSPSPCVSRGHSDNMIRNVPCRRRC